jgi:hypothetical protein
MAHRACVACGKTAVPFSSERSVKCDLCKAKSLAAYRANYFPARARALRDLMVLYRPVYRRLLAKHRRLIAAQKSASEVKRAEVPDPS